MFSAFPFRLCVHNKYVNLEFCRNSPRSYSGLYWLIFSPLLSYHEQDGRFSASFVHLRRKALQPPSQSFATANAKLCNRQCKALHPPTQSFASAHAKLCIRLRKALLEKAPSFRIIYFMTVNAKHCDYPCKRILVNALLFRNPLNFRNKSKHGFLDKN